MFGKILVAYDGSEGAGRALEAAFELAGKLGSELFTLTVQEPATRFTATVDEIQEEKQFADDCYGKIVAAAQDRARAAAISLTAWLRPGHPAKTIVAAAQEGNFDAIFVGHTGHSGVWAAFLGTTAEKVSRHAPCTVVIVR